MMKKGKFRLSTLLLGLALCVPAVAQRGYYKDIFMDGGISVSSRTTLPSATVLNLTMDYLTCSSHKLDGKSAYNAADSIFQLELLGGNAMDENGILFVCFPVTAIAAALSRSSMTVKRSLNELETAGLIMRVRRSIGEPNRIYVLTPREDEDVSS